MKFLNAIIILATVVAGAPEVDSALEARSLTVKRMNLAIRDAEYQGDGIYVAHPNDEATEEDIARYDNATAAAEAKLVARGEAITCSGRSGNKDLLRVANEAAARNAENHGYYGVKTTGWVYYQTENSFFCNYEGVTWNYNQMIDRHISVSNACGEPGYGYARCTEGACGGVNDASVGRTFYGDHYC
ncbi:uncharacterized protein BCR38DRAFT_490540 [Pseudomassariella vexata]|uniref:SCP domain-containing protein n=1 Tax=Pseudomassariella vexata TaxID=1141098 RepID=A0A1Y2DBL0_9PEZI|nr:uncharacterized protein BCR38DRAFT_490540 [Pseudomassariella vexata]ORY56650.1 hypothetical protein BCR38DRAFT_490540 [Pseudomassariella vexata]